MAIGEQLRQQAENLSYHQRKALKYLGSAGESERRGVGPRSFQQLIEARLAVRHVNGVQTLKLSEKGQALFNVLEELDWFPPD